MPRNDLIASEKIIEEALTRFRDSLYSRLECFPLEAQKMLRYIHEHLFEETLTVEEVKRACGLTNNNVTTKFRQSVGLGAREYIVDQRLKAATAILHEREVTIYLLAAALGYTEEAGSKLFKKTFGCPPLQYRKKVLREIDKRIKQEEISREMVKQL